MKLAATDSRGHARGADRLSLDLIRVAPYGLGALSAIGVGAFVGSGRGLLLLAAVGVAAVALFFVLRPHIASMVLLGILPFGLYAGSVGQLGDSFSLFVPLPLVLLAATGMALGSSRPQIREATLPTVAFGGLVIVAITASVLSVAPVLSASRVLYLVSFGLFGWVVSRAVGAGTLTIGTVTRAIIFGGVVAALGLIGQFMAQFAVGRPAILEWLTSVSSLFASKQGVLDQVSNYYVSDLAVVRGVFPFLAAPSAGQYMMVCFLVAVWYARRRGEELSERARPTLRWIAVGLIGLGLLVTLSRQAWAGALVGLCFMGLQKGLVRVAVVSAIPVLILVFVQVPGTSTTFGSHLTELRDISNQESSALRLQLWGSAIEKFSESPVIGVGPGVYTSGRNTNEFIYAHNMYLDTAVELGALGFLAFIAFMTASIITAARRNWTFALPVLISFAVANMFDDTFYFPRNGFLIAAVIAVAGLGRSTADGNAVPGGAGFSPEPAPAVVPTQKGSRLSGQRAP